MNFYNLLVALFFIALHLFLIIPVYDYRDNINYLFSYDAIRNSSGFSQALISYKGGTGASEPTLFILQFLFSDLISYIVFNSILNFFFLITLYAVLQKYFKRYLLVFLVILIFDYYIYRFTGELHRLKIAILFFMLAMYFNLKKIRFFSMLIAVLSHFQIVLLCFYAFFRLIEFKRFIKKRSLFYVFLLMVFSFVFVFIFKGALLSKFYYYLQLDFPVSTFFIGFFYLFYVFLFDGRGSFKSFFLFFLIVFPVSFLVGSDRMNFFLMEYIFIFELYKFFERKNVISLFILLPIVFYNSYKIIGFFNEVLLAVNNV